MRFISTLSAIAFFLIAGPSFSSAQARALMTNAARPITLPVTAGQRVILGSVLLGEPRSFSLFNIQATGTITPDPDLNGAAFQLEFLICDQADCGGELHSPMRILPDEDAGSGTQVLATRSFGVSTHNVAPVVLTSFKSRTASGVLFLAASLRVVHTPSSPSFAAKLNLLRLDVLP